MNRTYIVGAVLLAGVPAGTVLGAETVQEALKESKFSVNYRVRYEGVDQVGIDASADAITSRMRAGFETAPLGGTSLLAEAVFIEDLVDDYNSTTNGQTMYPVVADPTGFRGINRFAIINKSLEKTTFTLGRQRIILDDARFVGNVGWRQNEQTYDALRAQFNGSAITADFAYADQVNRVFGPDSPVGEWQGDVVLASLSKPFAFGKLTAFSYMLDLDNAAAASSHTVGLRFAGAKPIGDLTASYIVSVAEQTDAGANPADFTEDYYLLEGGLGFGKFGVALGYEQLGSDGSTAFSTPLATLHAFQGWADKFLGTPAAGMDDSYARFSYRTGQLGPFSGMALTAVYHDFEANQGSMSYGDEIDLSLVASTARLTFTLKYASYDADALLTDNDKYWLSLDYAF